MATHMVRIGSRVPALLSRTKWSLRHFSNSNDVEEEQKLEEESQKSTDDLYHGISAKPFHSKASDILLASVNENDIEIKPDGLIYLPEIMYRRILNRAFGPGGWALMPRGDTLHYHNETEGGQLITRAYAMYCDGRFAAQATGEHAFYSKNNLQYGKACESAKSNALMRCCKDLGVASELWDPKFIAQWKSQYATELWCENVRTKDKKKLWRRKDRPEPFAYPWKEIKS